MRFVVIRGPEPAGPFELRPGPNVIGRDAEADLRLPSRRVSRRHAIAVVGADHVLLRDLDSANGIVDEAGKRQVDITVKPGQRVQVGDFVLRLEGVVPNDIELDLDDPLTAEDDLLLDNDAEDTPLPQGPVPVMRGGRPKPGVPDPARATFEPRPFPPEASGRHPKPAAPAPFPPPFPPPPKPSTVKPAPAKPAAARPAAAPPPPTPPPPPKGATANPSFPPSLTAVPPLSDHPTAETSARMPPPLLPFGPPTGGFAGFSPPPPPPAPPAPIEDRAPPPPVAAPPSPPPPAPPPPLERYRDDPPTGSDIGQRASTRLPALRREPAAAVTVGGLPWLVQAGGVLAFAASLLVCAPVGGLGAQVANTNAVAVELSLQRGEALTEGLANRNGEPLANARYISLDAGSALHETGVRDAAIADLNGTVLAPPERARTSITRKPGWTEAVQSGATVRSEGADGNWEILAPIRGEAASGSGARTHVGWAWVAYDPTVTADDVASPWLRGIAGLLVVAAAVGVIVAGAWWLVVRPLVALGDETEHALHGHVDSVVPTVRWSVLAELAASINRVLQRARAR
jgi:pSer/pThr/pTyr-binding forkhead associated (FHA) protein